MRYCWLMIVLVLSGCGSGGGHSAIVPAAAHPQNGTAIPAAPGGFNIPFPADRAVAAHLNYWMQGAASVNFSEACTFKPDGGLELAPPLAGPAAWAQYVYSPEATSDHFEVALGPDSRQVWIGVADYAVQRWQFSGPFGTTASMPLTDNDVSPLGNIYVVVVVLPGETATVNTLQFWCVDQPPMAEMTPSPNRGDATLNVSFDASKSTDPGGSISKYEFDYGDGAGFVTEETPLVQHNYLLPGLYIARVRITDDRGYWGIAARGVLVQGWQRTTVSTGTDDIGESAAMGFVASDRPIIACRDNSHNSLIVYIGDTVTGSSTTWTPCSLADVAGDPEYISLAVDGGVGISYYDHASHALHFVYSGHPIPGNPQDWKDVTVDHSAADVGWYSSLQFIDGKPSIAYYNKISGDLKFAFCSSADGGSNWGILTVDAPGNVGTNAHLALVHGSPAIAYYDLTNARMKFAFSTAANGSSGWSCISIGAPGTGQVPGSLGYPHGRPAISYCHAGFPDSELGFTMSNLIDGSDDWFQVTVANTGQVGASNVFTGANGDIGIYYVDDSTGSLKVAMTAVLDGSHGWTSQTIDPAIGSYGSNVAAAIDAENHRAVAYYDQANHRLKYAELY